jgi:hypothetical protein
MAEVQQSFAELFHENQGLKEAYRKCRYYLVAPLWIACGLSILVLITVLRLSERQRGFRSYFLEWPWVSPLRAGSNVAFGHGGWLWLLLRSKSRRLVQRLSGANR